MTAKLKEIILAVDKINSWVRSESIKGHWTFGAQQFKRAFYFFKKLAIKRAHEEGAVWARGIRTQSSCHRCGGTGTFVNWDGVNCGPCRGCSGTGTATLKFLETHIDLGVDGFLTWHHPEDGHGGFGSSICYYLGSVLVHDWKPNTTGKDLAIEDALRGINRIEEFFVDRPADYWGDEPGEGPYNDFLYCWPLPDEEAKCEFCGETALEKLERHHCTRHFIEWTGVACKQCDTEPGSAKIFDRHSIPIHQITPEIRTWQNRHADFYNSKLSDRDFSWRWSIPQKTAVEKL